MRKIGLVRWILLCLLALPSSSLAQGGDVVASTSWTGALARAAGAEEVHILAPPDLQNPAAYELTAEDMARIRSARWIIYSGEERFASRLEKEAGDPAKLIRVNAENTPDNIRQETQKIARALGTDAQQAAWIQGFEGLVSRVKAEVNAEFPAGTRAVVHRSQVALARWLGFEVVGEMAPPAPSPQELDALAAQKPALVIDSYHEPVGPLLAEASEALYVQFISYPGPQGTVTLEDVLRYNRDQLVSYPPVKGEASSADKALPWMAGIGVALLLVFAVSLFLLWRMHRRGTLRA